MSRKYKDFFKIIDTYNSLNYDELSVQDNSMLLKLGNNKRNRMFVKEFLKLVKKIVIDNLDNNEKYKISYNENLYTLRDFYSLDSINIEIKEKFIFRFLYNKCDGFKEKFISELSRKYNSHYFVKTCSFVFVFLIFLFVTSFYSLYLICYGPSQKARNIFVSTFLETGALKFIPGIMLSQAQINDIIMYNGLENLDDDVDTSVIEVSDEVINDVEIEEIYGNNYYATLMIVHDPSKISLATTYPFTKYGKELNVLVEENDAIAGINGGLYESLGNKGGYPVGVVVSNGKIVYNKPYGNGYYLIGFDNNNILKILSLVGLDENGVINLVNKEGIRDAVTFQEEYSDSNNHFVKLIINGENRKTTGLGSGANPRTAIGQRADGSVLLLVTDGRGTSGHLGATANDLIEVMSKYGAVNAANIDGGSSSSMFYDGKYLMTSVTLYLNNSSWRLPDAFIVKK